MDFKTFYKTECPLFENYLFQRIANESGTQLEEAMNYSLEAGGKRLRPLIVLAVLKAFGSEREMGYPAASAIEMIHTYSLIHDDLPAMDDDDTRRGKPTNHIQFNESTAILAGDGLLTYAFEEIVRGEIEPEIKVKLIQLLAETSGYKGMVGGQQADINAENADLKINELESIHLRKTGELIRFSFLSAGLLLKLEENSLEQLSQIAKNIGVAYQIRDDLLDVVGDAEKLGKATGADEKLGKSTYPSILGLENAKERLEEKLDEAKAAVKELKKGQSNFDEELIETFIDELYLEESM